MVLAEPDVDSKKEELSQYNYETGKTNQLPMKQYSVN